MDAATSSQQWTALGSSLCLVPQGTTPNSRIGEKMYVHSVHGRGWISMDPGGGVNVSPEGKVLIRWQLVLDTQANGVQAAPDEHLADRNGGVIFEYFNSFRDLTKTRRFKVLMEKDLSLEYKNNYDIPGGSSLAPRATRTPFKFNYRFRKPLVVNLKGATGVIDDVQSNNLYMVGIASNPTGGAAANGTVAVVCRSRIRFTD